MSEFDLGYIAGVEIAVLRLRRIPLIGRMLATWIRKLMV